VAECYGRGDARGVQDASRLGVVASMALGLVMAVLLIVARGPVAGGALEGAGGGSPGGRVVAAVAEVRGGLGARLGISRAARGGGWGCGRRGWCGRRRRSISGAMCW